MPGRLAWVLLLSLLAPSPASAEEIRYEVYWGGFRAAEVRLAHQDQTSELTVRATGLVDSVTAFALEAERQAGEFRAHSKGRKWESLLAVDFTGTPRIVIDEVRRSEPEKEPRPPVPDAMKAGTLDPLSALVQASQGVLDGRPGDRFTLAIYDGRNRYDAKVSIDGPHRVSLANRVLAGTRATLEIVPLAGFRKKSRELWDGAVFSFLVDPVTGLPTRIVSESFAVGTVVTAMPGLAAGG